MRRPAWVAAIACVITLLALASVALAQHTRFAFTLGVAPATAAVTLQPGQEACQTPILVPPGGSFDRVVLKLGTFFQAGPDVEVQVRELGTERVLGRGRIAAGYGDVGSVPEHAVGVGDVREGARVKVCVADRGSRRVAVYGNADAASRTSSATLNGRPTGTDMTMRFETAPRSLASLAGDMAERAALFKTSWAGPWTFWLLALLVLVAVPVLLVRAVRLVDE